MIEQDALAIVYACQIFRTYLIANKFIRLTYHPPFIAMKRKPIKNNRIYRWSLSLEDLDFEISYIPGKRNNIADYLSLPTDN